MYTKAVISEEQNQWPFSSEAMEHARKVLEQLELEEKTTADSHEIYPPARLSDDIFRTMKKVRAAILKEAGAKTGILIPMEFNYGNQVQEVELDSSVVASLMATAQVALRWEKTEQDPITPGIEFARKILAMLPQEGVNLDDLERGDFSMGSFTPEDYKIFQGLNPLRTDERFTDSFEKALQSIPDTPPPSDQKVQRYYVERHSDSPEHVHISAIIRAIMRRTKDLSILSAPDGTRAELRAWKEWSSKIERPFPVDAEGMFEIYKTVMVPRAQLQALTGIHSAVIGAQKTIEQGGGFLHAAKLEDIYPLLGSNHGTFVVRNEGKVLGYTSVLTDTNKVTSRLSEIFGYSPDVGTYSAKSVPTKNAQGKKVTWISKKFAADVLNSAEYLAESIEVAVLPNAVQQGIRTTGIATALKHAAYSHALNTGKTGILVRHFEIISVNGKAVPGGLMNAVSRQFILGLRGQPVGNYEETFQVHDLTLKVLWHVYVSDLRTAVDTIEKTGK